MILCILLFIPQVALSFPCGMTYELAKTCKDLIDTKSFTPELATCQAKFNEICNVDDCKQSYFCKSCDSLFNGDQAALMMGMPATCTSAFNQIIANDLWICHLQICNCNIWRMICGFVDLWIATFVIVESG